MVTECIFCIKIYCIEHDILMGTASSDSKCYSVNSSGASMFPTPARLDAVIDRTGLGRLDMHFQIHIEFCYIDYIIFNENAIASVLTVYMQ